MDLANRDKIFQSIITKLRPSGEAIIIINDKKNLCRLYLDNVIDDDMFVGQIAQSRYVINEKNILDSLQDHFNVININKNNGKIVLHLGKKQ